MSLNRTTEHPPDSSHVTIRILGGKTFSDPPLSKRLGESRELAAVAVLFTCMILRVRSSEAHGYV